MGPSDVTQSPMEISLLGRTLKLSPLSDKDYGDFEAIVRSRYIQTVKDSLDGLNAEERMTLLREAFKEAQSITLLSPQTMQYMMSLPGLIKLLHLSLRRQHPEVTEEVLTNWVSTEAAQQEVAEAVAAINDISLPPRDEKEDLGVDDPKAKSES